MKLQNFRFLLDEIDNELFEILTTRFAIIRDLGRYKKKRVIDVYQPLREKEMLVSRKETAKKLGLSEVFIGDFFRLIFRESRRIQSDKTYHSEKSNFDNL
ncbi:chorismate mutase [Candidatus Peregrinibacteria bacterium]|nr:chorismate mutase [Candidatus Peregrinibacteria bacterium]